MKTRRWLVALCLTVLAARLAAEPAAPKFDEVYQLLRSNLHGLNAAELDRAAVRGLIEQLPGQVEMAGLATNKAADAPQVKGTVLEGSCAYLQVASVGGDLAGKLRSVYDKTSKEAKGPLAGVILDLRFAGGADYAAAAAAADCFLNSNQRLLNWGTASANATPKTNAIPKPVAILVNHQTMGAAESLAAILHDADSGLILGSPTAGRANVFQDFTLSNGEKLRVASAPVLVGDGVPLDKPLAPDIPVAQNPADEKAWQEDPYKILHPPPGSTTGANVPARRPINEAELVRQRRAGETPDDESDRPTLALHEPPRPALADAALARAVDLIKSLAVMQSSRTE